MDIKHVMLLDGVEYDIGMNDQRCYSLHELSQKEVWKEVLDCESEIRDLKSQIGILESYIKIVEKSNSGDHRKTQKHKESEVQ
jgi:hypothetical protein